MQKNRFLRQIGSSAIPLKAGFIVRTGLVLSLLPLIQLLVNHNEPGLVWSQTQTADGNLDGQQVYSRFCATCHGTDGRGNGPAAVYLLPKPRDFTSGVFKLRSTPTGTLPTDSDLLATVTNGMPGSGMPAFPQLSEAERRAVVDYLKQFYISEQRKILTSDTVTWLSGAPVTVGKEPPVSTRSLTDGKNWYSELECFKCHGTTGKGDGPSADQLKDIQGYPVAVRDFTIGDYKGGNSNRDLYLRFTTGMDGSPMPAYGGDILTDQQRWNLVHYVQSLKRPTRVDVPPPKESRIIVKKINTEIPADNPRAPLWKNIEAVRLPLNDLWEKKQATGRSVLLKTACDAQNIAFLLEWEDPRADTSAFTVTQFRDAAALQFAFDSVETSLPMGDSLHPVNIWHWKADWQVKSPEFFHITTAYKNSHSDFYFFQQGEFQEVTYLTGQAAENPFSFFLHPGPVEDLNAKGFGTLTPQPKNQQNLKGWGIWSKNATGQKGVWQLLLIRGLTSPDEMDVKFIPGRTIPIAVAIWDGSQQERAAQKAVTNWYRLILEMR